MGKTEQAWENLFKKYDILRQVSVHGDFCITAGQIREEREVRLMTKFDHSDDRPPIFKKNKLSILPLDRSRFLIGPFECYQDIKDNPNGAADKKLDRFHYDIPISLLLSIMLL